MRAAMVAAVLALAGCPFVKTSTHFGGTGGGGGGGAASDGGGGGAAGGANVITMPDLTGKTEDEAAALVRAAGFTQAMEHSRPLECEGAARVEGRVNCQDPEPGKEVRAYTLVQVNIFHAQHIAGAIVRDQLLALIGKTPAEARRLLAGYGHTGKVSVEADSQFHDGCAKGAVCGFDVAESGIGVGDDITLYTNKESAIAAPPPE